MGEIKNQSVGEIVAKDYRAAQVFEQHRIDFCCNGGRSIQEVAQEQHLDLQELIQEIEEALTGEKQEQNDFESWPLDLLVDYIVKTHHKKAEEQIRTILPYLDKIVRVHGSHHSELIEINSIFKKVAGEIAAHQKKEEIMLFPFIKKMVQSKENNEAFNPPRTVEDPVDMLTDEHDIQGEAFKKIAKLSNDFTTPEDGCNTYNLTLSLLRDFEKDLHKHIHLENNILFPKSLLLEKELKKQ